MPLYDFDHPPDRRNSDSSKWRHYSPDILPLWIADMDFVSPQPVIEALQDRLQHGVFGYPLWIHGQADEISEFCQTLVERMERLYRWKITPQDIILMPGVVTAFNLACHALAGPQEAVLIQTPIYSHILHAARTTGILGQEMELTRQPDGCYTIDWEAFEAPITSQTRMFILCNPHNPAGRVFHQDELTRMAEICLRHKIVICSDEIHCDLVYPGHQHVPIASLSPEVAQNTITLMAPTKTFNIAGLQCSFAIIPNPEIRKQFLHARKGLVAWVNLMGLVAAQAAYQRGQEWLDQVLAYLTGNRDFLVAYVRENLPGVQVYSPEGTYLAWLDCRATGIESSPCQFFLDKGRVALNDGAEFGKGGQGFVRLNFACSRATLLEALERMRAALLAR